MKIRKFDGYMIDCCEDCCRIHFYEDDLWVYHYDQKEMIKLRDWFQLTLRKALEWTYEDDGNWVSKYISCYVKCPLCKSIHAALDMRLYHVKELGDAFMDQTIQFLTDTNKLTIYHLDTKTGVEPVYGPEEEI